MHTYMVDKGACGQIEIDKVKTTEMYAHNTHTRHHTNMTINLETPSYMHHACGVAFDNLLSSLWHFHLKPTEHDKGNCVISTQRHALSN